MSGLGGEFRAAREARHLSLSDVSDQIHIRSVYLQNLEDGDSSFAAPVYVRGFVRTYARFLGLEPEAAVAKFNLSFAQTAAPKPHEPIRSSRGSRSRAPSPWLWVAGLAAAILVGFVAYRYFDSANSPTERAIANGGSARHAAARVLPVPSAAPKLAIASQTADVKRSLSMHVTRDSWVSVKIDGAPVLEGVVKAGSTKSFHGKTADVRAGNAGGVDLTVNGKALGRMGNVGDVVERNFTLASEQ